eukprot:GHRR01004136.1.p1 GENE.GHRR01004136.1~~GHRR01004136.1.p1  ORF type:complete len:856 (+),score=330.29 GHRR01004136.1:2389-4956(+)
MQTSDVIGAQASKFYTTETFTTTHGFIIQPASISNAAGQHGYSSSDVSSNGTQPVEQPSTPVGWSGLLEISRASGAVGMVGSTVSTVDSETEGSGHLEVACTAHTTSGVKRLVKSVIRGLKARQDPEAAREGMGGTYFFANELGTKCAIFKPCDEEPLAPANPKGYIGRALGDPGWKSTVRVGEAAMREVAAYLLDHEHFAQVPHTVLVQAQHPMFNYNYKPCGGNGVTQQLRSASASSMVASEVASADGWAQNSQLTSSDNSINSKSRPLKLGSLQDFVYHIADTNEMGASRFRARDVHAIGILDIRLFNTDRHAGNILVREPSASSSKEFSGLSSGRPGFRSTSRLDTAAAAAAVVSGGAYELIPIDHGFCLPEALEAPYFEWLHWPQACLPFDEEELAYISRFDVAADIALLQQELPNLRPECLRVLEVATTFLKRCAAAGLTLADIGALASRPLDALDGDDSCPSELEKACVAARQAIETRELAAMLSSSSNSSDGTFALREEDEHLALSSEPEAEQHSPEQPVCRPGLMLQPQHRPQTPSRLARMGTGHSEVMFDDSVLVAVASTACLSKGPAPAESGSTDLGSVISEGTVANLATAMSLGSNPARVTADGDLLFDLDDDAAGSSSAAALPPAATSGGLGQALQRPHNDAAGKGQQPDVVMAAASSLDSSLGVEQLSKCINGAQAAAAPVTAADSVAIQPYGSLATPQTAVGIPRGLGLPPVVPGGAGLPPVARSVHMGGVGGWMFRGLKAKANSAALGSEVDSKKTAVTAAAVRRRSGVQPIMYPPPVVRAPPRATNEVLTGLAGAQWAAFMVELKAYMDEALRPGTGSWRRASEAAGIGAAAMSCPRF